MFDVELCTNLASRLTLSAIGLKRASTWPMSHRSTTGCVQNDNQAHGTFGGNHAPKWFLSLWYIQHKPCTNITLRLTPSPTDQNEHPLDRCQLGVPWVWPKQFPCPRYVKHKLCTYLAPRLTLSPYKPKQAYSWPMSPRSSIRHTQNDSHAMVRLAQTMHRSRVEINTTSKWIKISFHLT
jgi:hypothetical protein